MEPKKTGFSPESLLSFFKGRFSLEEDKAAESDVIENIRRGVEFKGTNLWVLIFATYVASLGLNVNSTAVIIGAMLISPLMGPIMGIGLSVGINDFELMKRSLRNFGFMVLVSIVTSTLYFVVSPLSNAQSELLARTVPTTYDVLIAFFGGLAGIVAQSRKDRTSTVIPGVAIATALMPPLCTAGFGLATGQFQYFIGAFYLFFINTVFIALATYVVVRFLKYPKKEFVDKRREQKVRRYILIIVFVTLVPSVVMAYRIVQRSIFETTADRYVNTVFSFKNTQVIDYKKEYTPPTSTIEVILIGEAISPDAIDHARAQLKQYGLSTTTLIVHQSGDGTSADYTLLQTGYSELLKEKNKQISELEGRIAHISNDTLPVREISAEMKALTNNIKEVGLARAIIHGAEGQPVDTILLSVMKFSHPISDAERKQLVSWLQVRTKTKQVKLIIE